MSQRVVCSPRDTLLGFLNSYLVDRDQETLVQWLGQGIVWLGFWQQDTVVGRPDVVSFLASELRKDPLPYAPSYSDLVEQELTPECRLFSLHVLLRRGSFSSEYRVSCTLVLAHDGGFQVSSLHCTRIENQAQPEGAPTVQETFTEKSWLAETLPGGCLCFSLTSGYKIHFANKAIRELLGYATSEAFTQACEGTFLGCLTPEERAEAEQDMQQMLSQDKTVESTYRFVRANGSLLWVRVFIRGFEGRTGERQGIAFCFDCSREKETEERLIDTSHRLRILMENVPGGALVFEVSDWKKGLPSATVLFISDSACTMLGLSKEEYLALRSDDLLRFVHPDDVWLVVQELDASCRERRPFSCTYRLVRGDGAYHWVKLIARIFEERDGKKIYHAVYIDIHAEILMRERYAQTDSEFEMLYSSMMPGGQFRVRYDAHWTLLEANQKLYDLLGWSRAEFQEHFDNHLDAVMPPEDRAALYASVAAQLAASEGPVQNELRLVCKDGGLRWIVMNGQQIRTRKGETCLEYCFLDVSELKKEQEALRLSEEQFRLAIEHSNMFVWEYDIPRHEFICQPARNGKGKADFLVEGLPEKSIQAGTIHPDSVALFQEIHQKLDQGAPSASGDILVVDSTGGLTWQRVTYTTVFDSAGLPLRAIGTAENVNGLKAVEHRYAKELAYLDTMQSHLLASYRVNVTADIIEDSSSSVPLFSLFAPGERYSEMVVGLNESIPDQMEQAMVLRTLRPRNLLDAYREGKRSLQLEYRRVLPTEENIWVLTTINLMKDPFSEDILSFILIQNITHEKTIKTLIESVVRVDYDFLLYIDLEKDTAQRFGAREPFDTLIAPQMIPFSATQDAYIQTMIHEEDQERCKQELSLATIWEHLQSAELYSVLARMQIGTGPLLRKQFHMFYPEGEFGRYVILTCSDVTHIYEEEQNKTALLRDALKSAEQASVAKSEFLSRMSHEIRTPMNAIIGMSTLAAQAVHDPRHVADCLSKVGLSARFLLSLINDILDMSRIESGNVVLKKDTFPFAEFINGISTMIHTQAEAKGIDYDAIVIGFTDDVYSGDALKLQQVLVNILSNAVKFTPAGGKVQFHIQEVSRHGSDATMRFTVNDTGEGISEEFLPKIFDPFAQSGGMVNHTGTGLGLAISKNFVDLMGGTISVQSILGIGTEFNIVVPLSVSEESLIRASQKAELNLRELKTLIVDDDVVVCEHTRLILEELGASAEWVDSGFKAVTLVDEKWKIGQVYNIILVDWKMPNMDGIETTRKIRKIVGPDVTIIIMTAYDWQNIEQEARQAGVNMFINKPMFKASLCSAFERIWGEKQQSSTVSEPRHFDFSGKRVLLVEDHILNVEVAKKLLQSRNMAVDVATNGLKAIESFMMKPAGYYDAILMDVRMPVMDGLMAARNIRLLDKPDSKTIPIIAMTANAFEEDIEKSRASGMDAHLAKPIDAEVLYQTLNNFISR